MDRFAYEDQGDRKYLVYERKTEDRMDTVALEMLSNNRIDGVIPPNYIQIDDQFYVKYDITGMTSLKKYLQGVVNRRKILSILESIADTAMESEEYMLNFSSYVLDWEYIYIEPDGLRIAMVVLPVVRQEISIDIFLKELIMGNRYDETEDSSYVVSLINLLGGDRTFSIYLFKEELARLKKVNGDIKKTQGKVSIADGRKINQSQDLQMQRQPMNRQIQSQDPKPAFKPQEYQPNRQQPDFSMERKEVRLSEEDRKKIVQDLKREQNLEILFSHEKKGEVKKEKKGFFFKKENSEKEKRSEEEKRSEKKSLWEKLTGGKKENQNTDFAFDGNSPLDEIDIPGKGLQIPNQGRKTVKSDIVVPFQNVETNRRTVDMRDFTETEYAAEEDTKDTIMGEGQAAAKPEFILYRRGTGESFRISEEVTRMGRGSFAEIRIVGNEKVSRNHAVLYLQNGEVFIEDNNSKNKTYVDGNQIKPGQLPVKLTNGAKIRLGSEELEFCIQ